MLLTLPSELVVHHILPELNLDEVFALLASCLQLRAIGSTRECIRRYLMNRSHVWYDQTLEQLSKQSTVASFLSVLHIGESLGYVTDLRRIDFSWQSFIFREIRNTASLHELLLKRLGETNYSYGRAREDDILKIKRTTLPLFSDYLADETDVMRLKNFVDDYVKRKRRIFENRQRCGPNLVTLLIVEIHGGRLNYDNLCRLYSRVIDERSPFIKRDTFVQRDIDRGLLRDLTPIREFFDDLYCTLIKLDHAIIHEPRQPPLIDPRQSYIYITFFLRYNSRKLVIKKDIREIPHIVCADPGCILIHMQRNETVYGPRCLETDEYTALVEQLPSEYRRDYYHMYLQQARRGGYTRRFYDMNKIIGKL